jgi:hypothetical protein
VNHLYGRKWNSDPDHRRPVDPMTEDEAHAAWDAGEVFSVSAGPDLEPGRVPAYTLDVGVNDTIVVTRWTDEGRKRVVYFYTAQADQDRELFLGQVDHHEGGYRCDEYRSNGWGRTRREGDGEDTIYEFKKLDLSGHRLPALEWGDWDRVGLHDPQVAELDPAQAAKSRTVPG